MVPTAIGTGDLGGATVALTTTTETVAVSSVAVPMPNELTLVVILASVSFTAGSGTTSAQLRIRRGTAVTGTQVGQTHQSPATASAANSASMMAVDQQQNGYQQQYSLTVQQVGATGNGSVTSATILVLTF